MVMSIKPINNKQRLILGLGQTGLSVARFLHGQGHSFKVMDSREKAPGTEELASFAPDALLHWNADLMLDFDELVVSPGIAVADADIQAAVRKDVKIIGDIELFAQAVTIPVIAITGSNGKSTVTDLVGKLIAATGKKVLVGGNIGVPALDLLSEDGEIAVLELSSFQLETTSSLQPIAATILNVSEDHLDRYESYQQYIDAKHKIYNHAAKVVTNLQDSNSWSLSEQQVNFGVKNNQTEAKIDTSVDWVVDLEQATILNNQQPRLMLSDVALKGCHNAENLTAAFALLSAAGIEIDEVVLEAAKKYQGLGHRCQLVAVKNSVTFINDSKATNVGATVAAINSYAPLYDKILLIAGGDAKGADLTQLTSTLRKQVAKLICFGKDAKELAVLAPSKSYLVTNLAQAVVKSLQLINEDKLENALVLLSPACASLDMFKSYQERGNQFANLVEAL